MHKSKFHSLHEAEFRTPVVGCNLNRLWDVATKWKYSVEYEQTAQLIPRTEVKGTERRGRNFVLELSECFRHLFKRVELCLSVFRACCSDL